MRERYPVTNKFGRRGVGNFFGKTSMAPTPCEAPPGSLQKIAVLMQRAQDRQHLFHPEDNPGESEDEPPLPRHRLSDDGPPEALYVQASLVPGSRTPAQAYLETLPPGSGDRQKAER
jgi:hypothetical protein